MPYTLYLKPSTFWIRLFHITKHGCVANLYFRIFIKRNSFCNILSIMEPHNQISLAFTDESIAEQQVTSVQQEQPVNVGVRIKALKQNAAPVAEPAIAETVATPE